MTTLLLARHGETDWNREHRWQGHAGPPLNDTGRRQAVALAQRLPVVDDVYSSDTERAYETAKIVAEPRGLEVRTDARLREVNFGLWEGLTRGEIDERFGSGFSRWLSGSTSTPDGGESDEAMAARVLDAVHDIAARHPTEHVLVVTRGGPIRAIEAHLRGWNQAEARSSIETVANCSLLEVVADGATLSRGGDGSLIEAALGHRRGFRDAQPDPAAARARLSDALHSLDPRTGAAAVIFDAARRVLVVKENYERRRFSLPGGAVDPGETPQDAVLREVLEETGVVAAIDALIGTYALDNGFVVHAFECSIVSGTPRVPTTGEIAELAWYRPDEIPRPVSNVLHHALPDAVAGLREVVRSNLPRVS